MSPSHFARITCEFESIDLADLAVSRLHRLLDSSEIVQLHPRMLPKHVPDLNRKKPFLPIFFPGTELLFFRSEKNDTTEPQRIRSITADIRCRRSLAREISGKLTSLGASHIRIH